ncbi:MAG TPA: hypothetical protein VG371_06260, partial [Solirubrobacteraceae bacterium]|nr:hypothetical protein [Solirubrobacteraceae bacterium]
GQVFAEAMATRAVISGRRTFENAGRWGGDHHDGVPVLPRRGRRLYDNLPAGHIELELIRRLTSSDDEDPARRVLHLRYRVHHRLAAGIPDSVGRETGTPAGDRRTLPTGREVVNQDFSN